MADEQYEKRVNKKKDTWKDVTFEDIKKGDVVRRKSEPSRQFEVTEGPADDDGFKARELKEI